MLYPVHVRGGRVFIFDSAVYTVGMIKIFGNDLMRGSIKIGWLEGNDILDENGRKLGYYSSNDIYDAGGRRIGYTEGASLVTADGKKFPLDDLRERVSGGSISDLARAAILLLIGD